MVNPGLSETSEQQSLRMYNEEAAIASAAGQSENLDGLRAALEYAVALAHNYAREIREGNDGHDLFDAGFCQGSVYRGALKTIERIVKEGYRP